MSNIVLTDDNREILPVEKFEQTKEFLGTFLYAFDKWNRHTAGRGVVFDD